MTAILMCLLYVSPVFWYALDQWLQWLLPHLDALDAQPVAAKETQMVKVDVNKWVML